jgi:hypothetical protein
MTARHVSRKIVIESKKPLLEAAFLMDEESILAYVFPQ